MLYNSGWIHFLWDLRERFNTLTTGCRAKPYSNRCSFGPENEGVHRSVLDFKGQKESVLGRLLHHLKAYLFYKIFGSFLFLLTFLSPFGSSPTFPTFPHCRSAPTVASLAGYLHWFSWEADCIVDRFPHPKSPPKFFLLTYFSWKLVSITVIKYHEQKQLE